MVTPAASTGANGDVEAANSKRAPADGKTPVTQKVLSVSAPGEPGVAADGVVMAYQILAPSFSNQGKCYPPTGGSHSARRRPRRLPAHSSPSPTPSSTTARCSRLAWLCTDASTFNISKTEEDEEFRDILGNSGGASGSRTLSMPSLIVIVFPTMAFSDVGPELLLPHADTRHPAAPQEPAAGIISSPA
ncbi:hypothetical protein ZWY2020_057696 [Hordeum vulgare]|nr:hypothetical protein ZWY2020_057696 [Hordeum vulgare]